MFFRNVASRLTRWHNFTADWADGLVHLFGFPLSQKEEENPEMISHMFRKVTEARGEDAKEMWREVMTEQKTLQTLPSLPNPVQNKEKHQQKLIKIKCSLIFFIFKENGVCFWKCSHTTCFHKRAVLCVGHFGSAVTILDKRVVSWSQNGGGFSCLAVNSVACRCVGRLLTERSRCIMC